MLKAISLCFHGQEARLDWVASVCPDAYAFGSGECIERGCNGPLFSDGEIKATPSVGVYEIDYIELLARR
jgi:hypothetical protein